MAKLTIEVGGDYGLSDREVSGRLHTKNKTVMRKVISLRVDGQLMSGRSIARRVQETLQDMFRRGTTSRVITVGPEKITIQPYREKHTS